MVTQAAVVGVGNLGLPVALRLASSGFAVRAYDIRPEQLARLAGSGVETAGSAREAVHGCQVVLLLVLNAAQVHEVTLGSEGILAILPSGCRLLCMSTIGPAAIQALEGPARDRGVGLLDAPVTGGAARAAEGKLTFLTSGPREVFEQAAPVLQVLGENIFHLGPTPGLGQTVKLMNQHLFYVNLASVAEAMAFGVRAGIDPEVAWRALTHGVGNSWVLEHRFPLAVKGEITEDARPVMQKDLIGLLLPCARALGAPLPVAEMTARVLQDVPSDPAAYAKMLRRILGVQPGDAGPEGE